MGIYIIGLKRGNVVTFRFKVETSAVDSKYALCLLF